MRIKLPIDIIELEPGNFHVMVQSIFKDGSTATWIIDTGASKTVFDKSKVGYFSQLEGETDEIHSAGIAESTIDVTMGELTRHNFGRLKVEYQRVALLDLAHINEIYSRIADVRVCGLLGGDFLRKYKAIIDYKNELLILHT